ncbi:hypothetical protein E1298_06565 [Actinomadura rubrisoli]|uniref:DUF6895 domain-containing protein n=1 Tax=Actinomadura rubrisoli TaxID=2530368 RepID=A0A4R5CC35_9ACTN|nr:hypothetical protein E1298_06565 [Actinomadura rubrisoli]
MPLVRGALAWLHRNRRYGTLPPGITADVKGHGETYKAIGEVGLVCRMVLLAGAALPAEQARARRLLDFCWAQLGYGDLLFERQLRHTLVTDPVEIYAHLAAAGYRHQKLEELAAHCHRLRGVQAVEQYPNRRLAVANALRRLRLPSSQDWNALTDRTWLGHTPEPWTLDWDAAYCLTHTVYHLADWGCRPDGIPPHLVDYLHRWLPVWLDVWTETRHWDLVGELVAVDACLPEPHYPLAAWRALAAAQHATGYVPCEGTPEPQDEPQDEAKVFRRHRHTTCVTAMAGALALRRASDAGP